MSSRLRVVLAVLVIGAVLPATFARAQGPELFVAQQPMPSGRESASAMPPEVVDAGPAESSQAPLAGPRPCRPPIQIFPTARSMTQPTPESTAAAGTPAAEITMFRVSTTDGAIPRATKGDLAVSAAGELGVRFMSAPSIWRWWMKGDSTPPLVTTSPNGTASGAAGVLGQPGTSVLYGGNGINTAMRSGGAGSSRDGGSIRRRASSSRSLVWATARRVSTSRQPAIRFWLGRSIIFRPRARLVHTRFS